MAYIPKMKRAFHDDAVPDGATTMGDSWLGTSGPSGEAGSTGGSDDSAVPAHSCWGHCDECGWNGPVRKSNREAYEDVHAHNNSGVGHAAYVTGNGGSPG